MLMTCNGNMLTKSVRGFLCNIHRNVHVHSSSFRVPVLRCFHKSYWRNKSEETGLTRQLKARIQLSGPLTVADYMREVLTNPVAGYYMQRDVFGSKGDFITSPEISQMFGELVAVWCVSEWMQSGSPEQVQVVELGPGRGTLADDMLRVFSQFEGIKDAVSLHLVEVSPKLSEIQHSKLTSGSQEDGQSSDSTPDITSGSVQERDQSDTNGTVKPYRKCRSKYGAEVSWYHSLDDVPQGFSIFVAHEFFDALPVHVLQKKDGIWHEVLVDIDDTSDGEHHLRFVLSNQQTAASKILLHDQLSKLEERDHLELCPDGGVIIEKMADRIAQDGGFALIADYGHYGTKGDTFRAFKDHQLHDPLCEPGTADLTADVDFSYFERIAKRKVLTAGPVTQEKFLYTMGINVRLQMLMSKAKAEHRQSLMTGYEMIMNPDKMGERFKFFSLLPHDRGEDYIPAGFFTAEES